MARLGRYDCPTGKHCYEGEKYALRALKKLRETGVARYGYPYRCDRCKGWHVASGRKPRNRVD